MRNANGLTQRQEAFCLAFIETGNASEAYRRAYKPKRMTAKSIHEKASHILAESKVRARVFQLMEGAARRAELTLDGTLRELHGLVHSDLRKVFDPRTGALLQPHQWPDDVARGMASVKVVEMAGGMKIDSDEGVSHVPMYTKEVKLWDKNAAIDKAMKFLGLYKRDNEQQPAPVVVRGTRVAQFKPFKGRTS